MYSRQEFRYHFVYKTTNDVNGKIYIGKRSTNDMGDGYIGSGKLLKYAIYKYGRESFSRVVLQMFTEELDAYQYEASIVDEEFVARTDTYNLRVGGKGGLRGLHLTQEHRDRIGKAHKGRKLSVERREHMSLTRKGKSFHTEEHIKHLSERMTGNDFAKGHVPSEETKQKRRKAMERVTRGPEWGNAISDGKKARYARDRELGIDNSETRRKIGDGNRGKKHSDETKKMMSEKHKGMQNSLGHRQTEEHRRKISEANKGRLKSPEERIAIGERKRAEWAVKKAAKALEEINQDLG